MLRQHAQASRITLRVCSSGSSLRMYCSASACKASASSEASCGGASRFSSTSAPSANLAALDSSILPCCASCSISRSTASQPVAESGVADADRSGCCMPRRRTSDVQPGSDDPRAVKRSRWLASLPAVVRAVQYKYREEGPLPAAFLKSLARDRAKSFAQACTLYLSYRAETRAGSRNTAFHGPSRASEATRGYLRE